MSTPHSSIPESITDTITSALDSLKPNDKAVNLLSDGYLMLGRLRNKLNIPHNSDKPFTVQVLGKDSTVLRGAEGVRAFYDSSRFKREGAMPTFVSGPLFGKGAVHGLDDEAHRVRKSQMVAQAYDDARVAEFKTLVAEEVENMLHEWENKQGNIYDDAARTYGRAAFRWAGLPLSTEEMNKRADQYSRLLDTFGNPATNLVAWVERKRLDAWAEDIITRIRNGELTVAEDSVAHNVANFVDEHGELLDARTAGIELQNLTRPTVAVSRFASFAAAALIEHPEWIERIHAAAGEELTDVREAIAFAQEIRRTKPFVPMLPALAKEDTEVSGCPIHKGQRVLIDILNTNSGASWEAGGSFKPERFLGVDDYEEITEFLPQGGMDVETGHRCPGEKIAIAALSTTIAALTRPAVTLADAPEDREFSWTAILTRPETGSRVRVTAQAA